MFNRDNLLSRVLVGWIYLQSYLQFLNIIFTSKIVVLIYYSLLVILFMITLIIIKRNISQRGLMFLLLYLFIFVVNFYMVSYKYYVAIEALTSMLIFLVPVIGITSSRFRFYSFLDVWYKIARFNIIIVLLFVYLYFNHYLDYGVFAGITIPNTISLLYAIKQYKRVQDFVMVMANIGVTFLFGGRMASFALTCVFLFICISCIRKKINRICAILFLILCIVIVMIKLPQIIGFLNIQFQNLGIRSRTIILLEQQLQQGIGNIFQNIYMANRDYIYASCIAFIRDHIGMPGGFGVVRYITDGVFYHAHNLWLELLLFFGVPGTFCVAYLFIFRFKKVKSEIYSAEYDFIILLILFYLIQSLTDSNFLNSGIFILIFSFILKNYQYQVYDRKER